MPAIVHGFGGRPGGDPQREQAHHHAAKVCQKVGGVRHDGQAVGQVASCREERGGVLQIVAWESFHNLHLPFYWLVKRNGRLGSKPVH